MSDIKDPLAMLDNPPVEQSPSKEREVHDVDTGSIIALDRNRSKAEMRAIAVDILDRGVTANRLGLDVLDGIHFEWVPNNAADIQRMRAYGFEVLDRHKHLKSGNPLHEGGGTEIIVGDVVAMGCSQARKDALDEIKSERFTAMHGKPGSRTQQEEQEFATKMKEGMPDTIKPIVESTTHNVTGNQLMNSIKPQT